MWLLWHTHITFVLNESTFSFQLLRSNLASYLFATRIFGWKFKFIRWFINYNKKTSTKRTFQTKANEFALNKWRTKLMVLKIRLLLSCSINHPAKSHLFRKKTNKFKRLSFNISECHWVTTQDVFSLTGRNIFCKKVLPQYESIFNPFKMPLLI